MNERLRRLFDRGADWAATRLDARSVRHWSTAPLCEAPLASPDEYRRIWTEAKAKTYPVIDQYEQELGAAIDPVWFQELALLTQVPIKVSAICYQHGRLLYSTLSHYIRHRERENLTIAESGTARGFSSLCMARAMADNGAAGKILTFDVLPHNAKILWNCLLDVNGPRTRAELLADYAALVERYVIYHHGDSTREMAHVVMPRVHFAFLDSVHTYDHVMAEFASIHGRQLPGDILFFDDYTTSYPGVVRAADEICRRFGYSGRVVDASEQRRYMIAERQ